MQSFIELLKDHRLILVAVKSLQAIVDKPEPAPAAAFDALRRLTRLLDAHLRAEAEFLRLDSEMRHPEFTALAAAHDQRFDDLVSEWAMYLREWTEENITIDWPTFANVSRWILARLTEQVEAENRSVYPAAHKHGMITLLSDGLGNRTLPSAALGDPRNKRSQMTRVTQLSRA